MVATASQEPEPSGLRLELSPLDPVVRTALWEVAELASHSGILVELDLESGARVRLDEEPLHRALLCLAMNAIEAMPDGGMLYATTRAAGSAALVTLRDTGPGPSQPPGVDPFAPGTTTKAGHSGRGLAFVRQVVVAHGGRIEIGKGIEGGAELRLHLPLAAASDD